MAGVTWQPGALQDIDGIAQRIAADSPRFAKLQVERFFVAAAVLNEHPLVGHFVPELKNARLREVHVGRYRIIYNVNGRDVDLLAVVHMKRDLPKSLLRSRSKRL